MTKKLLGLYFTSFPNKLVSEPFQHSLMFVGKAGAYPSGATFKCSIHVYAPSLSYKHQTRLAWLGRAEQYENSRKVGKFVKYDCEKLCNIAPGPENQLKLINM
jgi:hypothetical protein